MPQAKITQSHIYRSLVFSSQCIKVIFWYLLQGLSKMHSIALSPQNFKIPLKFTTTIKSAPNIELYPGIAIWFTK